MKNVIWALLLLMSTLAPLHSQKHNNKIDHKEIMSQLELDSKGKTEVVKNFPKSFPDVLIQRGKPIVYNKSNSNNFEYIGMPIGGIGAGQLYLGGDGQLWFWDIFNTNYHQYKLKGEEAYVAPYNRTESYGNAFGTHNIDQGFSVTAWVNGEKVTKRLNRDGYKNIEFLGQYPVGEVTYGDNEFPIKVKMKAFSPFVPLEIRKSMLPATVFIFTLTNHSVENVETKFEAWMENAVLIDGRKEYRTKGELVNTYNDLSENIKRIDFAVENANRFTKEQTDYGTMSLSMMYTEGKLATDVIHDQRVKLEKDAHLIGRLSNNMKLEPGEEKQISFVLTWHFPKTYASLFQRGSEEIYGAAVDSTRYYAQIYNDASAVSDHILKNRKDLIDNTLLWRDTWYDSTLPYWFLDRTFLNTSILASSTSNLLNNGMFYGTEGANQGPGTCLHVWGYAQALGRLFPELEINLREMVDFKPFSEGGALEKNGTIKTRWRVEGMSVDGQSGVILRTYLAHRNSKDISFLTRNYESLKKAMNGIINQHDNNLDGILSGPQYNTLDAAWYGDITWLSLYYTAALRAMSEMANEMEDQTYADYCVEIADKGRKYIEDNLFNGEYFYHKGNPDKPNTPGTYTGMEYSQLMGQSWAYQVGLGEIIDPKKASKNLESLWRYNFTTDVGPFRSKQTGGRWYAMPGEGGLIACTWPKGGHEVLGYGLKRFADYNNESQNGYEYAATSLMMWHNMPFHSLAHIWYMHNNRYHGSKRNPWCEVEWGIHYARSMASYGHFVAACGFEYHGPKGYMAFDPKFNENHFKAPFVAAKGWGTFSQTRSGTVQQNTLTLRYGSLILNHLSLAVNIKGDLEVQVMFQGTPVKTTIERKGTKINIHMASLELSPGDLLEIEIKTG